MPWNYRRSVKILPGVRWNIGKRGSSVTISSRKKRRKIPCCPFALLLLPFFAIQGVFNFLISPLRKANHNQPEIEEGYEPPLPLSHSVRRW
ncbi:MAG: DUF4236 domain-containing protein [Thermoplasmata archaeon]|nr:DUF4236 domain-containing protein [Thermoplasmata archaeon]